MTEYESRPRPVEVMRWDGTLAGAEPIMEWIRSKDEVVVLEKRGAPNPNTWNNAPFRENYLHIGDYLNASKRHSVIVYDPARGHRTMGDGDFDCYSEEAFAEEFRERTI